ncbi:MAG: hypothetical protein ACMVY4_08540 [Minwuia sp.]|uniref:hypothetical protein n=1 Tax=Minwuia sp. TaxID=2493630 RepID=UPI003A8982A6
MSQPANARDIADTGNRLIALIGEENQLLAERQAQRLSETEAHKQDLIDSWQAGVRLLQSGRLSLTGADRKMLMDTGQRLETAMIDHARRVARMKSINEGLIQVVASRAEQSTGPADIYGASGNARAASLARNAYRRPTALSVNRMV